MNNLQADRKKQREELGVNEFLRQTPLYLIINEEATDDMMGQSDEDIANWISATTGSRKYLVGTIFIM